MGIEAEIEAKEFENLMQGLSPDGSKHLSSRAIAPEKRRAVLECLFCAPKSVSIQALPGGDKQLLEAQMRAVELVVGQIEQEYVGARITIDGERSFVKTGNLIAIAIDHPESRSLDPHVHTHCLIVNATQSPTNGKWYALSNEQILADQQYLGLQYRHHLALEVQKLGYEIQLLEGGQFEIVGYSRPQLLASSQRQQQTLELAPENPTWEQRNTARLLTRCSKQHICEEELVRDQRARLQELEISFVTPGQPRPGLKGTLLTPQILEEAIAHCSEYQVAFRRQDLEKYILSEHLTCDLSGLNGLIEQNTELIRTPETNRVRYTTRDALARERATIRLMQEGQGAVKALTSTEAIAVRLGQTDLNLGQQQAVQLAATTTDRFIAWQGVAGAGKTYALKEVLPLLTERGYSVKALAPSAQAAKVLGEELQVEAQTVDLLLASNRLSKDPTPQYWIVDEAGLIGAKNGFELLQRATQAGARILFVGDSKQLSAVQAGNPFKSLQQAGIQTAYLNESRRQRYNPELKAAVDAIAAGEVVEGVDRLQANECIQTVAAKKRTEAIVKDYLRGDRASRAETLVLAGTHVERLAIASSLRAALKAEGSLGKEDVATVQLKAKNLSAVQLNKLNHFVRGDFIVPLRDYKRRGLKKGEVYEVVGVSLDRVELKAANGEILAVNPDFKKSIYQAQQIGIAVGDRLRWTRNDRALGRRNGQEFTVEAIDGSIATIAYNDGKKESLDLNRAQHLDYALVSTIYSSQGKTARRVLVACDRTINKESFYVAVSRPTHELKLYTDNPQELLELASRSRSKETVAEALTPPAPINATPLAQIKRNYTRGTPVPIKIAPTPVPPPIKRPPLPVEPFWSPSVPLTPPACVEASAWQELVANSVIHPAIAQLNFRSLTEDSIEKSHEAWEYLFYSAKLDRTNTGQLVSGILKRYRHIENGGWWCGAGVDPLSFSNLKPGEKPSEKLWGCFKPNTPRVDRDKPGKVIKYEHPLKTQRSIFLLHVPDSIAERIYQKEQINPSPDDRERGFWYCAWKYNLPITITEGAKKAACLLSQGHAAIGLPGIYAGYYSKDERGYPIPPRLHEELAVFATPGRQVTFCFDYETKPKTIRNIDIAIARTASLLQRQGCTVNKVVLPGPEKGVDDFILARGPLLYEHQYRGAKSLPLHRSFDPGTNHDRPDANAFNRNNERFAQSRVRADSRTHDSRQQQTTGTTLKHGNADRDITKIVRDYVAAANRRCERRQIERIARDLEAVTRSITELVSTERSNLSILHKLHATTAAIQRECSTVTERLAPIQGKYGTSSERVPVKFVTNTTENLVAQAVKAIVRSAQYKAIVCYPGLVEAFQQLTTQLDATISAQIRFNSTLQQSYQQRSELERALATDNNREWVKINTTNPLLEQYNGKIGEILSRIKLGRMEQTVVKIGNITPTFSPSDLEPVPAGAKSNEQQSQNILPAAETIAPVQLRSTSDPISPNLHHELIASQQPPTTHSTDIGKRSSKIFHPNNHPAPSAPSSSRTNRNKSASASHSVEPGTDILGTGATELVKRLEQTAKNRQAKANRNSPVPGTAASDRFGAIDTSIERRERLRSLVNSIRAIPLEAVAPYLGLEYDRATGIWNGGRCPIAIDGKEFTDRLADKKGRGAVSFVAHIRGTSLKESLKWLSDSFAAIQSRSLQSEAAAKQIGKSIEELDRSVDYAITFHNPTNPVLLSKRASENQREAPQEVAAAELQQLSDRELLDLDRAVKSYFDHQPTRPPTDRMRLLQSDIDTLKEQLDQLWQQQARQVSTVELLQKQPFHHLNPKYHKAFLEMQNIAEEINRVVELKQRKESLVETWNKRETLYQAWESSPKTIQMKDLEKALRASEIQERIQQELERQKQWQRQERYRGLGL